jgi:hypothetical protein
MILQKYGPFHCNETIVHWLEILIGNFGLIFPVLDYFEQFKSDSFGKYVKMSVFCSKYLKF